MSIWKGVGSCSQNRRAGRRQPPGSVSDARTTIRLTPDARHDVAFHRASASGNLLPVRDLRLDNMGEQRQRLLPTEVTELDRNCSWDSFLHDLDFGTAHDFS